MRKKLLCPLLVIFMSVSFAAIAHDFVYEYDGQTLSYSVISEADRTVMVKALPSSPENRPSDNLNIPRLAKDGETEYLVTEICNGAFASCNKLKSVTIPNSVTLIGNSAFVSCTKLESINIPNSVISIGVKAFYFCLSLRSLSIPNSITEIGNDAFLACGPLEKVNYASIESMCSIKYSNKGSNPMAAAQTVYVAEKELREVEVPNTVKSIGDYAFYTCKSFTTLTIPNSVTSIGNYAFYDCNGFNTLTIPNSVTSIGDFAFSGCSGIKSVIIGNSISKIGDYAFYECRGVYKTIRPNTMEPIPYLNTAFNGLLYNPDGAIIENGMVYGSDKKELYFAHVTLSGDISISDSVTIIKHFAFMDCENLISVTIPNSVIEIEEGTFLSCINLESISIGNSVKNIGSGAFTACNNLTKADFASVETLCSIYFEGHEANPIYFAENLYIEGKEVTDIVIPNSVQSIGMYNFYNCNITSVSIGNTVSSIGMLAFYNCFFLSSVSIPNSVKEIHAWAFENCSNIKSVYYDSEDPIECDCYVFTSETYRTATLYVPEHAIEKAKTVFPWQEFEKIVAYDFGGINEITPDIKEDIDYNSPYEIYNLNGIMVGTDKNHITPGFYIIRQNNRNKKIAIQ